MIKTDEKLIKILKVFTSNDIKIIEENDLQYLSLEKLHKNIKNDELFIRLTVVNALMSYQLQTTGEIYWSNFSNFFSGNTKTLNDFENFISLYSKRLINLRKKRLQKVLTCIKSFSFDEMKNFSDSTISFIEQISKCLKQKRESKTVVFSAKMLLYAFKIVTKRQMKADFGIMIPLDSRIKKISDKMEFWRNIEKKTSIPLLHIDSILWITMGMPSKELSTLDKKLDGNILILKEYLENFYGIQ